MIYSLESLVSHIDDHESDEQVEETYRVQRHKLLLGCDIEGNKRLRSYVRTSVQITPQIEPMMTPMILTSMLVIPNSVSSLSVKMMRKSGKMQYPRMDTLWK